MRRPRVGILGFGAIARGICAALRAPDSPLELAFVHARDSRRLSLPAALIAPDLPAMRAARPDIVVEAAHPEVVRSLGESVLAFADFMPLSVNALADPQILAALRDQAGASGTRLLIPHGAVVGADSLIEWRHAWQAVSITFRKHPDNIDCSLSPWRGTRFAEATILFDGPVRDVAVQFPRNVNAMVACALMTTGVVDCRARLIADPGVNFAELHIQARGRDGSELDILRRQPAVGVSGTEMAGSALSSLRRATHRLGTLDFV